MTENGNKILLVEDDAGHARLVSAGLAKMANGFEVKWVDTLTKAAASLQEERFDAATLDLTLPDSRGSETIATLRERCPDLPIVVLTSLADDNAAAQAIEMGAQDYFRKDELFATSAGIGLLARALRYAVFRQASVRTSRTLVRHLQMSQQLLERKNRRLARLCRTAQRFVDDVSHEFRTPLTVIKEYASILRDGLVGPVSGEQVQLIDVVCDRSEDLNRMVDDMLDVSRLGSGLLAVRRTRCRLTDIAARVLQSMQRKATVKGVALEADFDPDLPDVYCDPDKVEHVLINLGINAIKFCGNPGRVKLSAALRAVSHEIVVSVTDNGQGIEPEMMRRLFRRFKQLNRPTRDSTKGFGLGLSIAKKLVDLNFGRLTVQSRLEESTTFSFTIPLMEPTEITRRYLQQLCRGSRRRTVLLLSVKLCGQADESLADEADGLLHYLLRSSDLLFRPQTDRWMLLLATGVGGTSHFEQRLAKALVDANRNRLRGPLPNLSCQPLTQWKTDGDPAELLGIIGTVTGAAQISSAQIGSARAGQGDGPTLRRAALAQAGPCCREPAPWNDLSFCAKGEQA